MVDPIAVLADASVTSPEKQPKTKTNEKKLFSCFNIQTRRFELVRFSLTLFIAFNTGE